MKEGYRFLGEYIRQVDIRNKEGKKENLLGVSVQKQFIQSIANTVGTDFTKYKVVKKGQFTYIPDTSRRGDKIAIALLEDYEEGLVSNVYTVFEVIDTEKLLPEYLMLWFSRPEFDRYARFKSHGSVREVMDWEEMCKVELPVPDIEKQRKIVKAYKTITDRIALKQKINDNLTDQAQAIYQQHFVTKANPDWPLGHLSDLINVKYGKDHKKLADGAYPVYGSGGIMRYVEHPLYEKESVLIPRKGTLNNVMYVNQPFWSVDTMFYTEMKQANVAKFVYHYVKSKDLASMNAGSAVPSMTTAILNAMELRIPSEEALFQFENSVAPMYEMIKKNEDQSRKLAQLRDVLLSKLMSGEIDVSNLDL